MLIFDSTEIQYEVSFVRPSVTASISLCVYVANGGHSPKDHKQRFFFFFQLCSAGIGFGIINNNVDVVEDKSSCTAKKINSDLGIESNIAIYCRKIQQSMNVSWNQK